MEKINFSYILAITKNKRISLKIKKLLFDDGFVYLGNNRFGRVCNSSTSLNNHFDYVNKEIKKSDIKVEILKLEDKKNIEETITDLEISSMFQRKNIEEITNRKRKASIYKIDKKFNGGILVIATSLKEAKDYLRDINQNGFGLRYPISELYKTDSLVCVSFEDERYFGYKKDGFVVIRDKDITFVTDKAYDVLYDKTQNCIVISDDEYNHFNYRHYMNYLI